MNTIHVCENPYEIEGKASNAINGKSEGIELLHKIMKKQHIEVLDNKTFDVTMYAVSMYENQGKFTK